MARSDLTAWRWLIAGELRAFPTRFLLAALAIAIGVALAFAVHIVNRSAVETFGAAVRSTAGESDLQVRAASSTGFDELLFPTVIALAAVADASPVVELRARLGQERTPFTLLGLDVLRAARVSPSLVGMPLRRARATATRAGAPDGTFDIDNLYLSRSALASTDSKPGERLAVRANGRTYPFRLAGELPGVAEGQAIGVVDISAAQWRFGRLGLLDRIDLKIAGGRSEDSARRALSEILPANARLADPESETQRGGALSRAYRVNLDMLALVALLTGGFLVHSAQSLSVSRRLRQFALLRTLGLEQRALRSQLIGEGLVLGIVGSVVGLALGYLVAAVAMQLVGPDLGAGYFVGPAPNLTFVPVAAVLFFLFGLAVAVLGSTGPALASQRIDPAAALKNAGDAIDPRRSPKAATALLLLAAGAVAAILPPIARLPVFGYAAVGLLLAGGVAVMPWLARRLLRPIGELAFGRAPLELALARLLGAPTQAAIALGGIVASTGLLIAMAVMVTSFRGSVDDWLQGFLSADLYVNPGSSEPVFDPVLQRRLASTPGIAAIAFSKALPVTLDPALPPLQLIVRPVGGAGYALPLMARATQRGRGIPLWVSEPAQRLYRLEPGDPLSLPLGGRAVRGHVAGIWRDYARQQGAIVIDTRDYGALAGDWDRSEAAVMLAAGASANAVRQELRRRLPPELATAPIADAASLRLRALALFDRSFAITHGLEAIAILIGLAGVAATISAQTIARMREFGMLRHLGMTRQQILAMLASEGALLGLIGVAAGITLGLVLSQILVHVINPQSFNWTMATRIPWRLIVAFAAALVVTSSAIAVIAGRRAVSREPVRAVSEDW